MVKVIEQEVTYIRSVKEMLESGLREVRCYFI